MSIHTEPPHGPVKKSEKIDPSKEKFAPEAPEKPPKYLQVICPICRERPGFPCKYQGRIMLTMVHLARTELWEAFALGSVNELGINGQGKRSGLFGE